MTEPEQEVVPTHDLPRLGPAKPCQTEDDERDWSRAMKLAMDVTANEGQTDAH